MLICCRSLARTVPNNYVLLFTFTFCQGYLVAFAASTYEPQLVMTAAFMTAGVVSGLTIYAWTTKSDFTILGGCMWTMFFAIIMFAIFAVVFQSEILRLFYCIVIVMFFGFYIVFDT